MLRKLIFICSLACLSSLPTMAQEGGSDIGFDNFYTFAWDMNIPLGSDQYVTAPSYYGWKFEYRKMQRNNFSVGFDISWNSYYEYKSYQTYKVSENTDLTTDLYKYNYTIPMAITGHYYFTDLGNFVPYFGLGLGTVYSVPKIYVNYYEISGDNWGFLMRPEIGTIIKFKEGSNMGMLVSARYSYSTNKSTSFKFNSIQSVGFQVGLCWML